MKFIILTMIALTVSGNIHAMEYPGGGKIVIFETEITPRGIKAGIDSINLFLERAVLYKDNGWFTEDKEIAIQVNVKINAMNTKTRERKTNTFGRLFKFNVSQYSGGKTEIPLLSLPVLEWYKLGSNEFVFTSIEVEVDLVKKRGKTGFGKVVDKLITMSKKIPIPGNPYTELGMFVGDFVKDIMDDAVSESCDAGRFAAFAIHFGPDISNENLPWVNSDGAFAIIMGRKEDGKSGHIDIEKINQYDINYAENIGLVVSKQNHVLNDHILFRIASFREPTYAIYEKDELNQNLVAYRSLASEITKSNKEANKLIDVEAIEQLLQNENNRGVFRVSATSLETLTKVIQTENILRDFANRKALSGSKVKTQFTQPK